MPYHSALTPEVNVSDELGFYEAGGSVALAHDILHGIAPVFRRADAVYSEPAWRDGYALFRARAGSGAAPYRQYLAAVRQAVEALGRPTYLVIGKHMVRELAPERLQAITLRGYPCHLAIWGGDALPGCEDWQSILPELAERYGCLLDFCCGYGNAARAMTQAGKQFVCADINRKCVAVVAWFYMGWRP